MFRMLSLVGAKWPGVKSGSRVRMVIGAGDLALTAGDPPVYLNFALLEKSLDAATPSPKTPSSSGSGRFSFLFSRSSSGSSNRTPVSPQPLPLEGVSVTRASELADVLYALGMCEQDVSVHVDAFTSSKSLSDLVSVLQPQGMSGKLVMVKWQGDDKSLLFKAGDLANAYRALCEGMSWTSPCMGASSGSFQLALEGVYEAFRVVTGDLSDGPFTMDTFLEKLVKFFQDYIFSDVVELVVDDSASKDKSRLLDHAFEPELDNSGRVTALKQLIRYVGALYAKKPTPRLIGWLGSRLFGVVALTTAQQFVVIALLSEVDAVVEEDTSRVTYGYMKGVLGRELKRMGIDNLMACRLLGTADGSVSALVDHLSEMLIALRQGRDFSAVLDSSNPCDILLCTIARQFPSFWGMLERLQVVNSSDEPFTDWFDAQVGQAMLALDGGLSAYLSQLPGFTGSRELDGVDKIVQDILNLIFKHHGNREDVKAAAKDKLGLLAFVFHDPVCLAVMKLKSDFKSQLVKKVLGFLLEGFKQREDFEELMELLLVSERNRVGYSDGEVNRADMMRVLNYVFKQQGDPSPRDAVSIFPPDFLSRPDVQGLMLLFCNGTLPSDWKSRFYISEFGYVSGSYDVDMSDVKPVDKASQVKGDKGVSKSDKDEKDCFYRPEDYEDRFSGMATVVFAGVSFKCILDEGYTAVQSVSLPGFGQQTVELMGPHSGLDRVTLYLKEANISYVWDSDSTPPCWVWSDLTSASDV